MDWQSHIGYATATLRTDATRDVDWSLELEPAATYVYPPRRPEGLEVATDSAGVLLTWRPEYYSIAGYQVEVDGEPVGVAFEPRAVIRNVVPGEHTFGLREVWYDGTVGEEVTEVEFTVD